MAQNGLLDFLQGASNAATSNVSAPVDGLAWLLRKAGIPVPDAPIGGSDWMAKKGLTAKPQNYLAGLLGESVGGVAPIVAAAKAPQIAKGLLQVEANAAAPSTLPRMSERGAIVWHGSPHKFNKFDASKIGMGEGAQVYGHGLYLAESPNVARTYTTAGTSAATKQSHQFDDPLQRAAATVEKAGGDVSWAIQRLTVDAKRGDGVAARAVEALRGGAKLPELGVANLYKVDLPDNLIARMLDWDKPLSQQRGIMDALYDGPVGRGGYAQGAMGERRFVQPLRADRTGAAMLEDLRLLTGPTKAEETLRKAGIPGIRYLDGGSRGAGAGTSNFVVFPGEEDALRILERNGGLLAP